MATPISWTAEAEAKLKEIPFFVRPFARKKIEAYAQENNLLPITLAVYGEAKAKFNQKYN
ncbi:PCP reductase family protein [Synechocystis sp. LKSZ1]|uniref:PCP reductase family protein n=1 Tax=Synechocystis sp. LKSZ1 TaxID=3144951 RepID=UPI00336C0DB7